MTDIIFWTKLIRRCFIEIVAQIPTITWVLALVTRLFVHSLRKWVHVWIALLFVCPMKMLPNLPSFHFWGLNHFYLNFITFLSSYPIPWMIYSLVIGSRRHSEPIFFRLWLTLLRSLTSVKGWYYILLITVCSNICSVWCCMIRIHGFIQMLHMAIAILLRMHTFKLQLLC